MTIRALATGAVLMLLVLPAAAQSGKRFEVASIKRCQSGDQWGTNGGGIQGGTLVAHCSSVLDLIRRSYLLFADGTRNPRAILTAIEGGPAWIESERFEIEAKAEGHPDPGAMDGPMMQALLEERCKLKVHRETRDSPVYVLTVAKTGVRVPLAKQGCWMPRGKEPRPQLAAGQAAPPACGLAKFNKNGFDLPGNTMADFCAVISTTPRHRLDRIVIDRTGIPGKFDFHLEWPLVSGDEVESAPRLDPFDAFAPALQKLGLKLSPGKGPVEVLVIDHVEKPSAN